MRCHNVLQGHRDIDDHRILFELGDKGIGSSIALEWFHLNHQHLLFIESHVVVHHVTVLQIDKQSNNNQYCGDDKLDANQGVA